jgi:hypothetical protein
LRITKTEQEKGALTSKVSPTASLENVSSRLNSEDSSITIAASEDGSHSTSVGKVAEEAQILCLAQSCKEKSQLTLSLYNASQQESTDRSQTAMPLQCYTNFTVNSFKLKGGSILLRTQAGAEKVKSFHI